MKQHFRYTRGQAGNLIIILVLIGLIAVLFGDRWFEEKNIIKFYDNGSIRKIDTPPFAERLTSLDYELLGICDFKVGIAQEQASAFFGGCCATYGYKFKAVDQQNFVIEIHKNYEIIGKYDETILKLRWKPNLTPSQQAIADKMKP